MLEKITTQDGCWIQYQLNLRHITQASIADKACCSRGIVSHFLNARKNSPTVRVALAEALGYKDFEQLLIDARMSAA